METIKKYFKWGLIAVIILIIAIVLISKCSHQVKENKAERQEDIQLVGNSEQFDSINTLISILKDDLIETHMKDSVSKIAANRLINYWKKKALSSSEKADTIIKSNPILSEAFGDQDSLIAKLGARNDSLEHEKYKQWNNFNKLLAISEEQLRLQQETSAILATQRDRYKKKSDKRFVVGPMAGFDYRLQPTFGVGITYRLLRF